MNEMEFSRRAFLKNSLFSLMGLFGLGYLLSFLTVLSPSRGRERELVYYPLVAEEEVPRAGVKKSELAYMVSGKERRVRVFLVSAPDRMTVFSAVCSHLGCLVNYHKGKNEFICPCHGGRYDLTGKNIAGPPPAPLTRLPHRIEKGTVMVGIKI